MADNANPDAKEVIADALERLVRYEVACDGLIGGLREARPYFSQREHGGREGILLSLEAVERFLRLFPTVQDEGLTIPISILINALGALGEGNVLPVLKPTKLDHAPPASKFYSGVQALAVFASSELVKLGVPLTKAHAEVAKVLLSLRGMLVALH